MWNWFIQKHIDQFHTVQIIDIDPNLYGQWISKSTVNGLSFQTMVLKQMDEDMQINQLQFFSS